MERSLLKLKPDLFTARLPRKISKSLSHTLYSQLDRAGQCDGLLVRALDGSTHRDYRVIKYERTKAGLMGRVWLSRLNPEGQTGSEAKLVDDEEALGLKWKLLLSGADKVTE